MKTADIARSGVLTVLAIGAGTVITFASHILVSRNLGVAAYGSYAILIAWAMLLSLAASLGVDGAILKFVPGYLHDQRHRTSRTLILVTLGTQAIAVVAIGALLMIANAIGVPAFGWAHGRDLAFVILLMAATVGGNSCIAAMQASHRAVTSQLIAQVLRPLLNLAAIGLAVGFAAGALDASSFVAIAGFSNLAIFIGMAAYIHFAFPAGNPDARALSESRSWLTFSISNLLAGVAQQGLVQLPVLLVGNLSSPTEAGQYGVASRLAAAVSLGLSALSLVTISTFAKASHTGDREQIQRILRGNAWMAFAYAAAAGLAMWLLGPTILRLFGPGFEGAYPALLGLVIGLVIVSSMGSALAIVVMSGHPLVVALANLVGIILIVGLSALLIPRLGAIGGAIASAMGTVVAVGLATWFAYARLGLNSTILAGAVRHHANGTRGRSPDFAPVDPE